MKEQKKQCNAMKPMISKLARSASLRKGAVQQPRGQGSGVRDRGSEAQCNAMNPMISKLARSASLRKDAVQRARASQRPSPRRLHGFVAASSHEEIRGPGV
jgi:hypothetical protein